MNNTQNNETDTAMTVVADENIRELLKSGNIEDIQRVVQEGESALPEKNDLFSWSKGQVIGKYEIVKKIGRGGMGVIYLARHTQLDALRALKVLSGEKRDGGTHVAERFLREARIASQIRHPNVVEVMDVETDPDLGISYIVMEYVDGGSLRQILRTQSKLNLEQAIVTVQGVAAALSVAAGHKIVHRDIKPDNIMFTKDGRVKLADLGIAKKDDEEDNLTKTNVMMGTPAYLSPEQVENPKAVDIRSDIYSLGATFYEMLTGQVPYPGKTSYDILRKIFSSPVPDPRSVNPEIPQEIAALTMKMLAKEPGKRFQTPEQLLDALSKLIPNLSDTEVKLVVNSITSAKNDTSAGGTASSISVLTGTLHDMQQRAKRRKMLLAAGAGALLFLCLCIIWGIATGGGCSGKESDPAPVSAAAVHSLKIVTTPMATLRIINSSREERTFAGNSKGEFHIEKLLRGSYTLELSCPDHLTFRKKVSVPDSTSLILPLKQDLKKIVVLGVGGTGLSLHTPGGRDQFYTIPDSGRLEIRELKKGYYTLNASLTDYFPLEKNLTLDEDMTLRLSMEKVFKKFVLTTLPGSQVALLQNSQVKYSGKSDFEGKCTFLKVKKGVYELKITALYHAPHSSVLNLEKDLSVSVPLVRQRFSVTVYAHAGTKGELFANWKKIRSFKIPVSGYLVVNELDQGEYIFKFSREGYVEKRHTLAVRENTSLQISLEPLPAPVKTVEKTEKPEKTVKPAEVRKTARKPEGSLRVYITTTAPQEFLGYIRKNGLEIRFGGGKWQTVREFPFTGTLPAGESTINYRGKGVMPQSELPVRIESGSTSDFLLDVKPLPGSAVFRSNRLNTVFDIEGTSCKQGETVSIEPYREYTVEAKSGKQVLTKTISGALPGEKVVLDFLFERILHPMHAQYVKGMALCEKKEYKKALEILLPVARAKHPEAAFQVAEIYNGKLGIFYNDHAKADKWYHTAADLGVPEAAFKVARAIHEEDYKGSGADMLKYYRQAADNDNPEAAWQIAEVYREGFKEIRADSALSLKFLQRAAELGHADAMYHYGMCFEKGQGVPFNSHTAIFWLKKAAAKGHGHARRYLEQINQ